MKCQNKENFQRKCEEAYEKLASAIERAESVGVSFNPRAGTLSLNPKRAKNFAVGFSSLTLARQEMAKASAALSRHLTEHRC